MALPYSIFDRGGRHVASVEYIDDAATLLLRHDGEVRLGTNTILVTGLEATNLKATATTLAALISERHNAAREKYIGRGRPRKSDE